MDLRAAVETEDAVYPAGYNAGIVTMGRERPMPEIARNRAGVAEIGACVVGYIAGGHIKRHEIRLAAISLECIAYINSGWYPL